MVKEKTLFEKNNTVYLIDATAFCYRAFYALKGLSTSWGQPTNAIYGFTNMLNKILKENHPQYLAVCFDVSRKTFRQERYSAYKINRPAMPDALSIQLPFIREIIDAYGLARFEVEGFEADDIIATIVDKLKSKDVSIVIISSDKDILQLVDEKVKVFSPYKDEGKIYSKKEVLQRYGVEPEKIIDILALMGDDTDNIPGISGIGEKTAAFLIKEFKSLDNLIKNIDKVEPPNIMQSIKENLEVIELNRQLLKLNRDVPLKIELEDLRVKEPDYIRLYSIFKKLEFKRLLKDLPLKVDLDFQKEEFIKVDLKELKNFIKDELLIYCNYQSDEILLASPSKRFSSVLIEEAKRFLEEESIKKIGYDLKRTAHFLREKGVKLNNLYFDIMIAGYLLDPSGQDYSLDNLSFKYLSLILKQPDSILSLQSILKLYFLFKDELEKKSLDKLFYELEIPITSVLIDIEENGIKFDEEVLRELSSDVELKLNNLKNKIFLEVGSEFNLNSPQQLRQILFDKLKLPTLKKKRTGPSTDEEVLRMLSEKHKIPALILEYRQLMKLKSTYLEPFLEKLDPLSKKIYPNFSQVSAETGRIFCSHPNLQNLPIKSEVLRLVRKAVVPDNSWLICADYSQIELRVLAHLSGDPLLVKSFNEDKDIHKFTASLLYGIEEKEVTEEMRDLAKRVNFGIIYGLTAYGLSKDLGISQEEAQRFIDEYFLRYPKVKEFIDKQIEKVKKDGFVTTLFGRRRYLPHIHSSQENLRSLAQRQAINTVVQGTAADLIKKAMVAIQNDFKKYNLKTKMILQIHDELLFDVEEKEMKTVIPLIKEDMENIYKFIIPIKVVIKKGKNWLQMEEVVFS